MDKEQVIQKFWGSFGIPAYDELTVPDDAVMPYITYGVQTDSLGNVVNLSGSVWYRSTSWAGAARKAQQIAEFVGEHGFHSEKINGGYVWFTKGTPFSQRMSDIDESVKRVYINIQAEFLTAY